MQIATIGLDIAKNVFQVHGIDAAENVVVRRQRRRSQVVLAPLELSHYALPLGRVGQGSEAVFGRGLPEDFAAG